MAVYSFDGAFRNLNDAIGGIGEGWEKRKKLEQAATFGKQAATGDYNALAQGLFASGDIGNGLKALEVGHTRALQADAMRQAGQPLDLNSIGSGSGATLGSIGAAAQPQAGGQTLANLGNPNQIETRFMSGIREAGLTNPYGLATVAAYGKRESGWSPQNANRSWSDPSQSGQAGTSGGLFAWRNERLRNLYGFAQQRGENVGSITPETQAAFLASEDPTLIPRLNNANSVAEANQIMANAWRFAGYQGNSPEYNARLQTAMAYLPRYQGDGNTIQRATGQPQPTMVAQAQTGATTPDMARAGIARVDMLLNDQGRELTPQQRQSLEDRRQKYVQIAEADVPVQGAQPAQGFTPPGQQQRQWGIPPERARAAIVELTRRMGHPGNTEGQRAMYKAQIDQLTPYADPMRSLDRRSKELSIQEAERKAARGDTTGDITEYEYAQRQGYTGTFPEFVASKRSTTIQNNIDTKGAGKFAEKANEYQAKRYGEIVSASDEARQLRGDIDIMAGLIASAGSGKGAETRLLLAQHAKAMGLDGVADSLTNGKMGDMEAAMSLVDKLTPRMRVPGSGATSDMEMRTFRNSIPSLSKTPEGNRIIADTFKSLYDYQVGAGDIAGQVLRGEIDQKTADRMLKELPSPFDNFKSYQREAERTKPAKSGATPRAGTAQEYQAIPSGTLYQHPDGSIRRKP
ncbi:hypothetical protein GCM10019059_37760 [Camelimonas fluminis]|uniref:Phage tail lysozyme domain-containing protein n=1 Tax=Camelimonas fluminis TaxID=1576911 RepID=A0ABV7UNA7_9HYPH|nr:hypothetical protein [Camelimonas fluminis]GHE74679.1 hypothetical protein GCM10019059_37760 [Camelimonas fluminis]